MIAGRVGGSVALPSTAAATATLFEDLLNGVANAHSSIVGELHEEIRRLRAQLNCARVLSRGEQTAGKSTERLSDTDSHRSSNGGPRDDASGSGLSSCVTDPDPVLDEPCKDAGELPGEVAAANGELGLIAIVPAHTAAPAKPPLGQSPLLSSGQRAGHQAECMRSPGDSEKKTRTPKVNYSLSDKTGQLQGLQQLAAQANAPRTRRSSIRASTDGGAGGPLGLYGGNRQTLAAMLALGEIDGPAMLEPWPVWYNIAEGLGSTTLGAVTHRKSVNQGIQKLLSADFHLLDASDSWFSRLQKAIVAHPSSPRRLCWLCLGVVLICFDIIGVPLTAFEVPTGALEQLILLIGLAYWQITFFLSFAVGFHVEGSLELRLRMTAWHYATAWMCVDLFLLALDWACLWISLRAVEDTAEDSETARLLQSVRTLRYLRTLRLIRVMKIPALMSDFAIVRDLLSVGRSEYASLVVGILKHLSGILLINHIIACLWFTIGKDNNGWVQQYLMENDQWTMQYLTSLHWSLTQFTPASMDVQPQTLQERAFAVVVLLFAMITFSSFVSSITNLMTHLRMLKSEEVKQFGKLERFFRDNGVSFHLNVKVRRYLEHHLSESKKNPQEKDIEMLARLSEPLRRELRYELYSPLLSKHPFFSNFAELNLPAVQRLCHSGIRTIHLSKDDLLFSSGETPKAMHFVVRGNLHYILGGGGEVIDGVTVPIKAGQWVCEMVLWTPWEYQGDMIAETEAVLMALEVAVFHEVVQSSKAGQAEASAYAVQAVEHLNRMDRKTDVDERGYDAMVMACNIFSRRIPENMGSDKPAKMLWFRGMTKQLKRGGPTEVEPAALFETERRSSNSSTGSAKSSTTKHTSDC